MGEQAHRMPLALALGVIVTPEPAPFSLSGVPLPVSPTFQKVMTFWKSDAGFPLSQLLPLGGPFPAAYSSLQPTSSGAAIALATSPCRLSGLALVEKG